MNVIAVLSEKGGVGKTTIALDLAVAAVRMGLLSAVLDLDPQATASQWTDRRKEERPWVITTPAARLVATISKAKAQGVELIVIDTPPRMSTEAAEAARRADLVLIPVESHTFALETIFKTADLVRLSGNPPAAFVINKAPAQGHAATVAAEFITSQGFTVSPVILHLRAAHQHSTNAGMVAAEYDASSKAAEEAAALAEYVFRFKLNIGGDTNGKR